MVMMRAAAKPNMGSTGALCSLMYLGEHFWSFKSFGPSLGTAMPEIYATSTSADLSNTPGPWLLRVSGCGFHSCALVPRVLNNNLVHQGLGKRSPSRSADLSDAQF